MRRVLLPAVALLWILAAPPALAADDDRLVGCEIAGLDLEPGRAIQILIDRTGSYDETDRTRLRTGLEKIFAGLRGGDRLLLTGIRSDPLDTARLFDDCVPRCRPVSGWQALLAKTCGPRHELAGRQLFGQRLNTQLQALLDETEEASDSAIVRSIHRQAEADADLDALIVFSDFFESDYGTRTFWELPQGEFDDVLESIARAGEIPRLEGVTVLGFGLGKRLGEEDRSDLAPLQRGRIEAVRVFWNGYFELAGASAVRLDSDFNAEWMRVVE